MTIIYTSGMSDDTMQAVAKNKAMVWYRTASLRDVAEFAAKYGIPCADKTTAYVVIIDKKAEEIYALAKDTGRM